MKKKLGLLASSAIILAAQSSASMAQGSMTDGVQGLIGSLCPYVGADIGIRHMPFEHRFGGRFIKKNYTQGNLYVGTKLCDYLGLEVGIESTASVKRTASINSNDGSYFGQPLFPGSAALNTLITSSKLYGWHADIVGFIPLCDDGGTSLIGSIGFAQLRLKILTYPTLLEGGSIVPNLTEDQRVFVHKKMVARAALGAQQMVTDCAGIRATLGWENTKRFKRLTAKGDANIIHNATAKDSFLFNLGVFYKFF